jgi:hypothetical protein
LRSRFRRRALDAPQEPAPLRFRILADRSHDREAVEKAKAADGFDHPPAGYR